MGEAPILAKPVYQPRIPDPFSTGSLGRVDRPTKVINDEGAQRADPRNDEFHRAARGEYGSLVERESNHFVSKHPLSGALLGMTKFLAAQGEGSVADRRVPWTDVPRAMSWHIKETTCFLRAEIAGIGRLPACAIYTHSRDGELVELDHKYGVAILVDQDYNTASASTGRDWISSAMSFRSYSTSGFIACMLADYIRRLSYPARAHFSMNYQVVIPPILVWAGVGEMSRIGDIVVNPFLGPRFKASVVTTDLPLAADKPIDFGLQDFCSKCGKCAEECPAQAISYGDKVMHNGYERWPLDVRKCSSMRVANQHGSGCGTCIKVCPWNKPDTLLHRAVNWGVRRIPVIRSMVVKADDVLGYGKPKPESKWWLDLEDVEGALRKA